MLPYTVIDVGFWHQISFPPIPSGRVDYAIMMGSPTIHGDGNALNILTDLRDIGRFVVRVIMDDRTINRYIYTWSDVLSENEIFDIVEELSGEKIAREYVRDPLVPLLCLDIYLQGKATLTAHTGIKPAD